MLSLPESRDAWEGPDFEQVFVAEVQQLRREQLPLLAAMEHGNQVPEGEVKVMVLQRQRTGDRLSVTAGVFFSSVIGGCNCADDPSPIEENTEYCELVFRIDPASGATQVELRQA